MLRPLWGIVQVYLLGLGKMASFTLIDPCSNNLISVTKPAFHLSIDYN